jgi:hypothetical protein
MVASRTGVVGRVPPVSRRSLASCRKSFPDHLQSPTIIATSLARLPGPWSSVFGHVVQRPEFSTATAKAPRERGPGTGRVLKGTTPEAAA